MNTTIELKCLKVSPDNVRVLSSNKAQDKELVSSVQALGILQNMVVVKDTKDKYQIIAGSRRVGTVHATTNFSQ